ncbi:MFS transporter [Prauserella cavernicola]|uniref:MFS transporter n=1 Tax=Prauserella cavernicola TaxID=2800127 RepID=A0A934QV00_9PSEU|nr:MFS transporter [Prauserella cavernicola]MBK1786109.1 MFS transporter [Prauserella cavernicola]
MTRPQVLPGKPESPLRHRNFRLVLLASAAAFSGYSLLLPVVPLWAVRQGAGAFTAGAATGVFMASTVLAQFATSALVRRHGYRAVMVWGALFLGVPTPLLIPSVEGWEILGISLLRGIGFGLLTVCGSALIAELLPSRSVAKGSGLYGLAAGVPQLAGLPIGTAVAEQWGFAPVFVLATVLPLCALGPLLLLPTLPPRHEPGAGAGLGALVGATWKPWLPMLAVSTGFGALATFLPIVVTSPASAVALFVAPCVAMLSRWAAGHVGHRVAGPGRMLPAGLAVATVGLAGFALLADHGVLAIISVGVFGLGFGVVQNDALVAMFARARAGAASVAWNVAFDAGQGLGAVAVGAVVSLTSFGAAFGLLALAAAALLPVAVLARRAG